MGGKPSKGTRADKRLKGNKGASLRGAKGMSMRGGGKATR